MIRRILLDRVLLAAIGLGCLFRVGAFVALIVRPVANERGEPVSPLLQQAYLDFEFYLKSLAGYTEDWSGVFLDLVRFYAGTVRNVDVLISGPVFPALMGLTGFAEGDYLPLALLYLALSCALVALWLVWLRSKHVDTGWLLVFALIPNPVWMTIVVSPDLLFAGLFALFFILWFETPVSRPQTVGWVVLLVVMILTRPNAYSVLLFVALHASWVFLHRPRLRPGLHGVLLLLVVTSSLYLYPYFLWEVRKAGTALVYFGHTPLEYGRGIFNFLPVWLDMPASWLSLAGAKFLYFTGLRPSYGLTAPALVLARAAAGVVLLPGLLYLFVAAPRALRALVALYCLPIFLGPTQERYYLAVYPLLFLYGTMAWNAAFRRLLRVRAAVSA